MYQITLWFWYLVLFWFFTTFGVSRAVYGAEDNQADSERRLSSSIADFFLSADRDESDIPTADTVTVIASRLPSFRTRLSDIPANVSYIPANVSYKGKGELEQANPRIVQDSLRDAEGAIFYDQVGNAVDTTFSLRGFSEGSAVIVLVDGVRVNELDGDAVNYPLIPMNDIEFIQIERGSSSPIYGSGAFAGVAHIVTRKPSRKPLSTFGGVEISSFKGIRFNQGVSGTIRDRLTPIEGNVTYYFNMGRDLNDGFRENGEWRITSLDAKLGYELPDDSGSIHVGIKHIDDAVSNPDSISLDQFYADQEKSIKPLDGRDFRTTIIQIGADKSFWDHRIIASMLTYWRVNLIHFYTTTASFADFFTGSDPDTDLVTVKTRATDLVWQLAYEDTWNWFGNKSEIGMEFRDASEYSLEQEAFQGEVALNARRETERSSRPDQVGLFWRETVKFFEKIILHAGMRHDYHWLKTKDALTPTDNLSRRWHDSTVSTGITLKPIRSVDLFGNYSQGFRVPTISEIAPFSGAISTDLRPEKTDSYEVGTRLRYKDMVQSKFSYFLIDMKDEIIFDSTAITAAAPFGANGNVGGSRRYGIETRIDLIPSHELDVYGSFSWTKAYVRETAPGFAPPVDGRSLGLVPRRRFTLGAIVRPLYRLGDPYKGLELSMNGVFTGEQHHQNFETVSEANLAVAGHVIKPYAVFNGMVSFKWKNVRTYFKINNLFGEKYFSRAIAFGPTGGTTILPAGTYYFVTPGAPREYILGMTWEFGN